MRIRNRILLLYYEKKHSLIVRSNHACLLTWPRHKLKITTKTEIPQNNIIFVGGVNNDVIFVYITVRKQ